MPLNLDRWALISTDERLRRCGDLTTTVPQADSLAPSRVVVTFAIRCGPFQRGESASLPPEEASAMLVAGFAA